MNKNMKTKLKAILLAALKAALTAVLTTLGVTFTNGCAVGKNPTGFSVIERNF